MKMKKQERDKFRKMTTEEQVENWFDIAGEDLEVATLCLKGGKYLHAAFMCQQAVEKALKGYIASAGEMPWPTHNLPSLAQDAELWEIMKTNERLFIRALTTYAIEARYPEKKAKLVEQCTKEEAERILAQSEEMVKWLKGKSVERLSPGKQL